jgi:hypothetical protein
MLNLDRAAELLQGLLTLWLHPDVSQARRQGMPGRCFRRSGVKGSTAGGDAPASQPRLFA